MLGIQRNYHSAAGIESCALGPASKDLHHASCYQLSAASVLHGDFGTMPCPAEADEDPLQIGSAIEQLVDQVQKDGGVSHLDSESGDQNVHCRFRKHKW